MAVSSSALGDAAEKVFAWTKNHRPSSREKPETRPEPGNVSGPTLKTTRIEGLGGRQTVSPLEVESGRTSLSWRGLKGPFGHSHSHGHQPHSAGGAALLLGLRRGGSHSSTLQSPQHSWHPGNEGAGPEGYLVPSLQPWVPEAPGCHADFPEEPPEYDGCRLSCAQPCCEDCRGRSSCAWCSTEIRGHLLHREPT